MAGKAYSDRTNQRARNDFLAALRSGKTIGAAARAIGAGRQTVYDWRERVEGFKAAWDAAYEDGTDVFEDEATRRSIEGVERPIVNMGRIAKDDAGNILTERQFSDTLLLASMKRRRPDAWRERSTQDVNLKGEVTVNFGAGGDADL